MTKLQQLQENIFTQVAKLLALSQLKKDLPKAIKQLDDNPEIQATLNSLQYHVEEAERQLKYLCKKHPSHPDCKEKAKSK